MTQSIASTTSQQFISLIPSLRFKNPEALISFAEEEWLEQLNQIPVEKKEYYRMGIERVVRELEYKSRTLKSDGQQPQQIIAELSKTIDLYNTSYALFDEHNTTYAEQKAIEENQNVSLAEKFRMAKRSFQVYHLPEQTPKDPYKAQAQWEAVVTLGGIHAVGTGLQLAGAAVAEGAKTLCELTETTDKACKATLDFGKAVVDATGLPKAVQWVQKHGSDYLAEVIEERYEIPKDQAKQLAHQTIDDCLITATAGGTALASNFVLKRLFKPNPLSEGIASKNPNFVRSGEIHPVKTQHYAAFIPEISSSASGQQSLSSKPFKTEIGRTTNPRMQTPLTRETGQQLLELGEANATGKTFTRLKDYLTTQDTEFRTMEGLLENQEKILLYIPSLSSEGARIVKYTPFKKISADPFHQTTTLVHPGNRLIRQDFKGFQEGVSTFIGLNFLRSFNLDYTMLAEPIAFWENAGRISLVKTALPGEPLFEWIAAVGKLPALSPERAAGINQLKTMALFAGRSTGELQNKGSHLPALPNSQLKATIQSTIDTVEYFISNVDNQLELIGKQFKTDPEWLIGPVLKKFKKEPGPLSFGFGKIESSEFSWAGKPRSFGCLDTKGVLWGLDSKGTPLQFISEEPALFHKLFLYEGANAGLKISEIKEILKSYDMGYLAEYKGPAPSQAAIQLFDIHSSFLNLCESAGKFQTTKNFALLDLVEYQLNHIEKKLQAANK